jgi:hypothetical protein
MRAFEILKEASSCKNGFQIYVDMDGVLVDFDKGMKDLMGNPDFSLDNTRDKAELWKKVSSLDPEEAKEIWARLDWAPGGKELWRYLSKFDASILSSPGKQSRDIIEAGKWEWIRRNMNPQPRTVIFEPDKWKYAAQCHILIDDSQRKLVPWEEHGGVAIQHKAGRDDHKRIIKQLQKRFGFPRR